MCKKIDNSKKIIPNAKAYFLKNDEPDALWLSVEARLCECGKQWWTRTKDGPWVEAEEK